MTVSLRDHMEEMLQHGVNLVRKHERAVRQEWKNALAKHSDHPGTLPLELEFMIGFLTEHLFNVNSVSIDRLLQTFPQMWTQTIQNRPQANRLVFIMALLENAVHKSVIKKLDKARWEHQLIHYLFSKMSERILTCSLEQHTSIHRLLIDLVSAQPLPIHWAAIAAKKHEKLRAMHVYTKDLAGREANFVELAMQLQTDTLHTLSEQLLALYPAPENMALQTVIPVPWKEHTLLFCVERHAVPALLPFITFSLQAFNTNRSHSTVQHVDWKDAVIMFNEWIYRADSFEETVENIAFGFVHFLPFDRCALFSYSGNENSGLGLFGFGWRNDVIQGIKEDIDNIPLIRKSLNRLHPLQENIKKIQPIYEPRAKRTFPRRYVQQFQLESIIIAPIYVPSKGELIGAAILDKGPGKRFSVSDDIFAALLKFGQSAGELLAKFDPDSEKRLQKPTPALSPREIEVLSLIADGASTSEAAKTLYLSEYTVRDYVTSLTKKLDAKNRTEAAVKAVRRGVI